MVGLEAPEELIKDVEYVTQNHCREMQVRYAPLLQPQGRAGQGR